MPWLSTAVPRDGRLVPTCERCGGSGNVPREGHESRPGRRLTRPTRAALTAGHCPRVFAPVPLLFALDDEDVVGGQSIFVLAILARCGRTAGIVGLGDVVVAIALLAGEVFAHGEPGDGVLERPTLLAHDAHLGIAIAGPQEFEQLVHGHGLLLRSGASAPRRSTSLTPLGDEVNGGLAPALIPSRGKGAHNVLLAPARAWLPPARASSSHPFVGARAQFHGQARFQSVKLVLDLRGHPVLAARRPRRRFWRLQVVPTHPAVIKGDPFF